MSPGVPAATMRRPAHRRGTHVDDIVGVGNHVQVVFDDDYCRSLVDEALKNRNELRTSKGCKPIVGSSKTKSASSCPLPISAASFSRWLHRPIRPASLRRGSSTLVLNPLMSASGRGLFSRSLRLPKPVPLSVQSIPAETALAAVLCRTSNGCGFFAVTRAAAAGQVTATSGKNCTSIVICPVPSQAGQRSEPVL